MGGEYNYLYDEEMSGTWYERNRKGEIVKDDSSGFMGFTVPSLSPEIIAVIVGVAVVVIGGAAFLLRPKRKKKHMDNHEPVYQGGTML